MKKDKNNVLKIILIVVASLLGLIWLSFMVFAFIGAFANETTIKAIEEFFKLEAGKSLLDFSLKYFVYTSILLSFTLLFKEIKTRYIDKK